MNDRSVVQRVGESAFFVLDVSQYTRTLTTYEPSLAHQGMVFVPEPGVVDDVEAEAAPTVEPEPTQE
jgi:hypothetical protein